MEEVRFLTLFKEKEHQMIWPRRERDLVYCPKEEIFRNLARFTEAYSDPMKHLR